MGTSSAELLIARTRKRPPPFPQTKCLEKKTKDSNRQKMKSFWNLKKSGTSVKISVRHASIRRWKQKQKQELTPSVTGWKEEVERGKRRGRKSVVTWLQSLCIVSRERVVVNCCTGYVIILAPEMLKRGEKGVEGRSYTTTTTTHARAEKKTNK